MSKANDVVRDEVVYAVRTGAYADMTTLASTGPESLSSAVKCPLDNSTYLLSDTGAVGGTAIATGSTATFIRSGERRAGQECRPRWWPDHSNKKRYMAAITPATIT